MSDQNKLAAIEAAVERAEDRLAFLDRVPAANTATATHAVEGMRLEILGRMHEDIMEALGRRAPATPDPAA